MALANDTCTLFKSQVHPCTVSFSLYQTATARSLTTLHDHLDFPVPMRWPLNPALSQEEKKKEVPHASLTRVIHAGSPCVLPYPSRKEWGGHQTDPSDGRAPRIIASELCVPTIRAQAIRTNGAGNGKLKRGTLRWSNHCNHFSHSKALGITTSRRM
eukprot:1156063-Pelagomonas_calceolata.AAC.1